MPSRPVRRSPTETPATKPGSKSRGKSRGEPVRGDERYLWSDCESGDVADDRRSQQCAAAKPVAFRGAGLAQREASRYSGQGAESE